MEKNIKKPVFEKPVFEVVLFEEDIITTSSPTDDGWSNDYIIPM